MENCKDIIERTNNTNNQQELLKNITGLIFNPENGKYEYDEDKNWCFNTTEINPIGVQFWEENDEFE